MGCTASPKHHGGLCSRLEWPSWGARRWLNPSVVGWQVEATEEWEGCDGARRAAERFCRRSERVEWEGRAGGADERRLNVSSRVHGSARLCAARQQAAERVCKQAERHVHA